MNTGFTVSKVSSEFEIQAYLYHELRQSGMDVKGEARCSLNGKGVRFDLLIFGEEKIPLYAIEVKPKRRQKWRDMWVQGRQFRAYRQMPIPVFMVLGMEQAQAFLEIDPRVDRSGVVFYEDWCQQG